MAKKNMDGLTIRKLKKKDASQYAKIAYGETMHKYLSYFMARNVTEAEKIICGISKYNGTALYGLFERKAGLVSVFYVSPYLESAEISYFTGPSYYRNGYATKGVFMLAELLKGDIKSFTFTIRKSNTASLSVQKSIGSVELLSDNPNYRNFIFSF